MKTTLLKKAPIFGEIWKVGLCQFGGNFTEKKN